MLEDKTSSGTKLPLLHSVACVGFNNNTNTMKIALTKPELLKILSKHFGEDITDLTITKGSNFHMILMEKLSKIICIPVAPAMVFPPDKKIPAIKALREVVPGTGLAEAKWAIENWNEWIAFVAKHGRAPEITGNLWSSPQLV